MELANTLFRYRGSEVANGPAWDEAIRLLLLMLAPATPHIADELWNRLRAGAGLPESTIHRESWPAVDDTATAAEVREVPIQVNGKVRDRITVPAGIDQAELERLVLARPRVEELLGGRVPDRVIHAGGRLVNLVVRES
jgi:leucyl-tRNA synthetase